MRKVLILGAVRTPIGCLNGVFANVPAVELGVTAAQESFRRSGLTALHVNEVILGNVLQAGQGQNPARQVALGAGVPESATACTVNMVCGSGLKAIELGWQAILLGRADIVLAGGVENMTRAPYLLSGMRGGARLGDTKAVDGLVHDGLWEKFNDYHMGMTAENVAAQYDITRTQQDQFALESQQKYARALQAGWIQEEIVPVVIKSKKGETRVETDEYPRSDTTLEKLAALKPAFKPDGTVTAGNASGINDGAAMMVLAAAENVPPDLRGASAIRLIDIQSCGCNPAVMGLGPIGAVRKLLERNSRAVGDIDLWELNEAFASQSIACIREIGMDPDRVNVHGGAIALGHPIGATGARVATTLIHEMQRRQVRYGVATMCIGGGMGIAGLFERI